MRALGYILSLINEATSVGCVVQQVNVKLVQVNKSQLFLSFCNNYIPRKNYTLNPSLQDVNFHCVKSASEMCESFKSSLRQTV